MTNKVNAMHRIDTPYLADDFLFARFQRLFRGRFYLLVKCVCILLQG